MGSNLSMQGYGSELNYKIAAPLLNDVLTYLKVRITNPRRVSGCLHFTPQLLPFQHLIPLVPAAHAPARMHL